MSFTDVILIPVWSVGLTAVVGQCKAGHYCPVGSSSLTELLCPMGYYCGLGTEYPVQCPNGTFSNQTGLEQESECMACTPGMYCDGFALIEPSGPCDPGNIAHQNISKYGVTSE